MNEKKIKEKKKETKQEKKIYSEGRGRYAVLDDNKVFNFDFPIDTTFERNISVLNFMRKKIMEAIVHKQKENETVKEPESSKK